MANPAMNIRPARGSDLGTIIHLDERHTGLANPDYWSDLFARYVETPRPNRFFLVAEREGDVIGFVVGEIRAWEFGSPPCGCLCHQRHARSARARRRHGAHGRNL